MTTRRRAEMLAQMGASLPPAPRVSSPTLPPSSKARKTSTKDTPGSVSAAAGAQSPRAPSAPTAPPALAAVVVASPSNADTAPPTMPPELRLLSDFYGAMLSGRTMLRGKASTLEALQPAVQQLCGRTFTLQHLQQIKHLHPAAFSWRYLLVPSEKDPTRQEYQLLLGFERRSASAAASPTGPATSAQEGGAGRFDSVREKQDFDHLIAAHVAQAQAAGTDGSAVPLTVLPGKETAMNLGLSPSASVPRSSRSQQRHAGGSPLGPHRVVDASPHGTGATTPTKSCAPSAQVGGSVLEELLTRLGSVSKPPRPPGERCVTPPRGTHALKPPRPPSPAGRVAPPPISAAKRSLLLTMLSPHNVAKLEAAQAARVHDTPEAKRRRERTQALAMLPRSMDAVCSVFEFGSCVRPRAEVCQKMIEKATFRAGLSLNEASLQIQLLAEQAPEFLSLEPAVRGQPAMVRINRKNGGADTRNKLSAVVAALAGADSPAAADAVVAALSPGAASRPLVSAASSPAASHQPAPLAESSPVQSRSAAIAAAADSPQRSVRPAGSGAGTPAAPSPQPPRISVAVGVAGSGEASTSTPGPEPRKPHPYTPTKSRQSPTPRAPVVPPSPVLSRQHLSPEEVHSASMQALHTAFSPVSHARRGGVGGVVGGGAVAPPQRPSPSGSSGLHSNAENVPPTGALQRTLAAVAELAEMAASAQEGGEEEEEGQEEEGLDLGAPAG